MIEQNEAEELHTRHSSTPKSSHIIHPHVSGIIYMRGGTVAFPGSVIPRSGQAPGNLFHTFFGSTKVLLALWDNLSNLASNSFSYKYMKI